MTKTELRDRFATAAMQAFIPLNSDLDVRHVAYFAYEMADAMLHERKPKKKLKEFNHVACPAYPNCDEDPNGCRACMGDDVEEYGMRD